MLFTTIIRLTACTFAVTFSVAYINSNKYVKINYHSTKRTDLGVLDELHHSRSFVESGRQQISRWYVFLFCDTCRFFIFNCYVTAYHWYFSVFQKNIQTHLDNKKYLVITFERSSCSGFSQEQHCVS